MLKVCEASMDLQIKEKIYLMDSWGRYWRQKLNLFYNFDLVKSSQKVFE